jgi:hypothetical protein
MNLGEQLEELRVNILHDRSDLIAGDSDSLWTDETLLRYIGDGERRFARRTLILRDSTTPEVVRVKLKSGVTTYPAHASVLSVLSAKYHTDTWDLKRSGHGVIEQQSPQEFLSFDPTAGYTTPPGAPLAFYTDETLVFARQGGVTVSVYPEPGADEDGKYLYMRVIRLPMTSYGSDCLDKCSEIPEDYQLDVLEWAAYRAQRGFDSDAGAPTSADAHKKAFDEAVQSAIKEMKQKTFANTGLRFGGNGFTWTR